MLLMKRYWKRMLVVCVASAATAGCATDSAVISQANDVHTGIKPAVMTDPELNNYLQAVGDRIITAAKKLHADNYGPQSHRSEDSKWMFAEGMRFHFVNSKTLNAFTTGGEHMYIYNELFQKSESEDELAAVMAHEFAHVYARHVHKGMNRQYGILGGAAAAGLLGYAVGGEERGSQYGAGFASAAGAVGTYVGMGYTRKDESEADDLGFNFYTRAGWDPDRFDDFFQQMIERGYDKTPAAMSDHPTLASRVEATKKRVASLPPEARKWRQEPIADAQKFKQLQEHAAKVGESMPADKTLEGAQKLLAAFPSCVTPVDQPEQKQAQQEIAEHNKKKKPKKPKENR